MKKNKITVRGLQVICVLCLLALSLAAVNMPPLITELREGVVTIYGYDNNGNRSMGTGWLISDTRVVTCYHVIEGSQRLEAMTNEHRMIRVTGVAVADKVGDIAIITIPRQENIAPLTLASGLPRVGERVYVLSTPHGLDSTLGTDAISSSRQVEGINSVHTPISVGNISDIKRVDGVSVVQFTAPITHGCSGSPVVNARGEVVAVVQSMEGRGVYFGVEASRVRQDQTGQVQPQTQNRSNLPVQGPSGGGIFERANGDNPRQPAPRTTNPRPQPQPPRPPSDNGTVYDTK